jgi:hypothetical protein
MFESLETPADLLGLQLALVGEIEIAERAIASAGDSGERAHRQLIRGLGDAVAWRCLHPYAIRQLHFSAGAPPSLSNQAGLGLTLECAEEFTQRGVPVVVCDVTNCLGTGDVVAVTNPEVPMVIECGNPRYSQTPRKRRQALRADAALEQLRSGEANWPERSLPTRTIEVSTPTHNLYEAVESAIQRSITGETAIELPNDDQIVFAIAADSPLSSGIFDELAVDPSDYAFGITTLYERLPSPRISPPHVWPIKADCRRAVIESDVIVGHLVRLAAFDGPANGAARLLGAERRGDGIYIRAENGEEACVVLPGPIEDLLGNFQTVESSIEAMLETLDSAQKMRYSEDGTVGPEEEDGRSTPPPGGEFPGVPPDLLRDLERRSGPTSPIE